MHELFWMLQCNCTSPLWLMFIPRMMIESTFSMPNINCFLCEIGYCCTRMKTRNAQLSRSSRYIFTVFTFLCLSLIHLVQVKQIVKYNKYQLTKRWLEGKLEGFFGGLKKMWLIEYRIVSKYHDFYHCRRCLHHHNSRGFHVRFYSMKQSLTLTT